MRSCDTCVIADEYAFPVLFHRTNIAYPDIRDTYTRTYTRTYERNMDDGPLSLACVKKIGKPRAGQGRGRGRGYSPTPLVEPETARETHPRRASATSTSESIEPSISLWNFLQNMGKELKIYFVMPLYNS